MGSSGGTARRLALTELNGERMKKCKRVLWVLAVGWALLGQAWASDDDAASLDRIEVTGSRISYRDLLDTPAISITKRGDYLSQSFELINDTRDEAGRKKELYATIAKLLERAGNRYKVLYEDTYPVELNRENYRVDLADDSKRPDTSRVTLRVRIDIEAAQTDGYRQVDSLREFIRTTPKDGRTEIELAADTALGMRKPERYRYELIDAISADAHRVRQSIGPGCAVELGGLNSRIEWERVGPVDLLLYVPYTMDITGCGQPD